MKRKNSLKWATGFGKSRSGILGYGLSVGGGRERKGGGLYGSGFGDLGRRYPGYREPVVDEGY